MDTCLGNFDRVGACPLFQEPHAEHITFDVMNINYIHACNIFTELRNASLFLFVIVVSYGRWWVHRWLCFG